MLAEKQLPFSPFCVSGRNWDLHATCRSSRHECFLSRPRPSTLMHRHPQESPSSSIVAFAPFASSSMMMTSSLLLFTSHWVLSCVAVVVGLFFVNSSHFITGDTQSSSHLPSVNPLISDNNSMNTNFQSFFMIRGFVAASATTVDVTICTNVFAISDYYHIDTATRDSPIADEMKALYFPELAVSVTKPITPLYSATGATAVSMARAFVKQDGGRLCNIFIGPSFKDGLTSLAPVVSSALWIDPRVNTIDRTFDPNAGPNSTTDPDVDYSGFSQVLRLNMLQRQEHEAIFAFLRLAGWTHISVFYDSANPSWGTDLKQAFEATGGTVTETFSVSARAPVGINALRSKFTAYTSETHMGSRIIISNYMNAAFTNPAYPYYANMTKKLFFIFVGSMCELNDWRAAGAPPSICIARENNVALRTRYKASFDGRLPERIAQQDRYLLPYSYTTTALGAAATGRGVFNNASLSVIDAAWFGLATLQRFHDVYSRLPKSTAEAADFVKAFSDRKKNPASAVLTVDGLTGPVTVDKFGMRDTFPIAYRYHSPVDNSVKIIGRIKGSAAVAPEGVVWGEPTESTAAATTTTAAAARARFAIAGLTSDSAIDVATADAASPSTQQVPMTMFEQTIMFPPDNIDPITGAALDFPADRLYVEETTTTTTEVTNPDSLNYEVVVLDEGIPFWVWILVGLGAAVIVIAAIVFTVKYCMSRVRAARVRYAPKVDGGSVAIVFTDIESSTALWSECPREMSASLDLHNSIIRRCISAHRGYEVKTIGDSFMIAFLSPNDAIDCSLAIQHELFHADWVGACEETRGSGNYSEEDEGFLLNKSVAAKKSKRKKGQKDAVVGSDGSGESWLSTLTRLSLMKSRSGGSDASSSLSKAANAINRFYARKMAFLASAVASGHIEEGEELFSGGGFGGGNQNENNADGAAAPAADKAITSPLIMSPQSALRKTTNATPTTTAATTEDAPPAAQKKSARVFNTALPPSPHDAHGGAVTSFTDADVEMAEMAQQIEQQQRQLSNNFLTSVDEFSSPTSNGGGGASQQKSVSILLFNGLRVRIGASYGPVNIRRTVRDKEGHTRVVMPKTTFKHGATNTKDGNAQEEQKLKKLKKSGENGDARKKSNSNKNRNRDGGGGGGHESSDSGGSQSDAGGSFSHASSSSSNSQRSIGNANRRRHHAANHNRNRSNSGGRHQSGSGGGRRSGSSNSSANSNKRGNNRRNNNTSNASANNDNKRRGTASGTPPPEADAMDDKRNADAIAIERNLYATGGGDEIVSYDYFGHFVNMAALIEGIGHGGQVLISRDLFKAAHKEALSDRIRRGLRGDDLLPSMAGVRRAGSGWFTRKKASTAVNAATIAANEKSDALFGGSPTTSVGASSSQTPSPPPPQPQQQQQQQQHVGFSEAANNNRNTANTHTSTSDGSNTADRRKVAIVVIDEEGSVKHDGNNNNDNANTNAEKANSASLSSISIRVDSKSHKYHPSGPILTRTTYRGPPILATRIQGIRLKGVRGEEDDDDDEDNDAEGREGGGKSLKQIADDTTATDDDGGSSKKVADKKDGVAGGKGGAGTDEANAKNANAVVDATTTTAAKPHATTSKQTKAKGAITLYQIATTEFSGREFPPLRSNGEREESAGGDHAGAAADDANNNANVMAMLGRGGGGNLGTGAGFGGGDYFRNDGESGSVFDRVSGRISARLSHRHTAASSSHTTGGGGASNTTGGDTNMNLQNVAGESTQHLFLNNLHESSTGGGASTTNRTSLQTISTNGNPSIGYVTGDLVAPRQVTALLQQVAARKNQRETEVRMSYHFIDVLLSVLHRSEAAVVYSLLLQRWRIDAAKEGRGLNVFNNAFAGGGGGGAVPSNSSTTTFMNGNPLNTIMVQKALLASKMSTVAMNRLERGLALLNATAAQQQQQAAAHHRVHLMSSPHHHNQTPVGGNTSTTNSKMVSLKHPVPMNYTR